jgi:hypothetical protein
MDVQNENSNLLYKFYNAPFCCTRFLEHDEPNEKCYKQTSVTNSMVKTTNKMFFLQTSVKYDIILQD